MSKHDKTVLESLHTPVEVTRPVTRRINVAVNAMMLAAIDRISEREQITMTEAVRRLIAYGDFVYETTKVHGAALIVRDPGGDEREVVVL
jgi:hypothetical protein